MSGESQIDIEAREKAKASKRQELFVFFVKSQEEFEKKITLVTTASFGGSVFLIEKVVPNLQLANAKIFLFSSWILLGLSLLLNLYSHLLSTYNLKKSIEEIDLDKYDHNINNGRASVIEFINVACFALIVIGITSLLFFSIFNLKS